VDANLATAGKRDFTEHRQTSVMSYSLSHAYLAGLMRTGNESLVK